MCRYSSECAHVCSGVYMCVPMQALSLNLSLTDSDRVTGWDYRSVPTMAGILLGVLASFVKLESSERRGL